MADVQLEHLVSLDHDDWQVADGEPDLRGWDVFTADERKIGEVDDMLADPAAMKVRYLTIDLDKDLVSTTTERTIRFPVSRARVHESQRRVVLDLSGANLGELAMASAPSQPWRDDQIRMTRSAEELRVGTRQVNDEVEVRKDVDTERVKKPVTLRHEEVEVERRPVSGAAASRDAQISPQEIRVPVVREEVVVETRPVVQEEVVIKKRPVEEERIVEADVRKERIEVEGQARNEAKRKG